MVEAKSYWNPSWSIPFKIYYYPVFRAANRIKESTKMQTKNYNFI